MDTGDQDQVPIDTPDPLGSDSSVVDDKQDFGGDTMADDSAFKETTEDRKDDADDKTSD
jgi:hypothetical protein